MSQKKTEPSSLTETARTELPSDISFPLEIRLHGRGGQGGVTCAKLIAAIYAQTGLNVQTFGDYGAERSGAPVRAFTRVDREPIKNRNKVYRPDHLLVLDAALLGPQVLDGVAAGAVILLNSADPAERYAEQFAAYRIGIIDATGIARKHGIGTSTVVIINTTLVGAYAKLLGLPFEVLADAYAKMGLSDDLEAAREAYLKVRIRQPSSAGTGIAVGGDLQTSLPPVKPQTAHSEDIVTSLKTGNWSTQLPGYEDFVAPCNHACPAGNDVVGFIQALKTSGPDAAAQILLKTQALPSVCGRVCPAPCMYECNRNQMDGAVNIRSLERWISDHSAIRLTAQKADKVHTLAVVGGGPAGLSAAYQLALRGHEVTLFEKNEKLGGVLRYGIPVYRLPEDVLERDLERILSLGIRSQCEHPVDKAEMKRLQREFDAVIVSKGFSDAMTLTAAGESLDGIEQGLDFLARSREGGSTLSGDLVVIGGGNTAIDCARSALRSGASSVKLVYRRSRAEMPAIAEEIDDAIREGVKLLPLRQPVAFRGVGCVAGIVLAEVELAEADADGRRRPLVTERTTELNCSRVLLALGQENDMGLLPEAWQMREARAWSADKPLNIWFAGDCSTADGTVTHAIGNGRLTALAALASLDGTDTEALPLRPGALVAPAQVRFSHFPILAPHQDRHKVLENYRHSFEEVNLGLSTQEEAERCFSCGRCTQCDTCLVYCPEGVISRSEGGYRIDEEYCKGCGICVAECPRRAIDLNDKGLSDVC
ncbi:FAD-dependent oxidoreductase [Geopsychrobacter electrodiphilus]|uniref:FAD-dependent oxidoreductase n=1 Tax=Geopsychrobacter electrodiphilus TaxID=225196 RepID=UPI000365AE08|nr:FAD-dependent oxidoreductase [Geopsychrobacter electrodiphilus]